MKKKFNLACDSFTHMTGGNKGYSVHGKESKYIRWVFDNSSQITFYVDRKIPEAFIDGSNKIKYGWILESKHVLENLTEDIKLNYKKYFDVFALYLHIIKNYSI